MIKTSPYCCVYCGRSLSRRRRKGQFVHTCRNKLCPEKTIGRVALKSPITLGKLSAGLEPLLEAKPVTGRVRALQVEDPSVSNARDHVRRLFDVDTDGAKTMRLIMVLCAQEMHMFEFANVLMDAFDLSELFPND